MSIRVVDWVWRNAPYQASKLLVLLAMADWADDSGGNIFPYIVAIGMKARLGERATRYAVSALEADGIVRRDWLGAGAGNHARWRIEMEREAWPAALRERIDTFIGKGVAALEDDQANGDEGIEKKVQAPAPLRERKGARACIEKGHGRAKPSSLSILRSVSDPSLRGGRPERALSETERKQRQGELAGLVAGLTGAWRPGGV